MSRFVAYYFLINPDYHHLFELESKQLVGPYGKPLILKNQGLIDKNGESLVEHKKIVHTNASKELPEALDILLKKS